MWFSIVLNLLLRRGSTSSLLHVLELYGAASVEPMWFSMELSLLLRVGSIPTLHLKTFEQLFWTTPWRKTSRKAQWQAQSRYLCHCAFLISFRYAGSEKTWPNHFVSISRTCDSPGGSTYLNINFRVFRTPNNAFYHFFFSFHSSGG